MTIKSIFLVDDSEAEQFLYKSIIEVFDPEVEVISAYDGQEAIELLTNGTVIPDVILLDINMPRVNGFEFLDIYQKQFKDEHIVITMVTSSSQTSDKEKAMSYDVVHKYFEKPLTMDHLTELKELLQGE